MTIYHADKPHFLEFWVKMPKMTLKVKVNDLYFQYQPRVSQDACLVLIWWFQRKFVTSYHADKVKFTDGRTDWLTDGQTQATTIPLRPERPRGKKRPWIQEVNCNIPKMLQIVACLMSNLCWKFHENLFIRFPVMLLTDMDFLENKMQTFAYIKMHLKLLSPKCGVFCWGVDVLRWVELAIWVGEQRPQWVC